MYVAVIISLGKDVGLIETMLPDWRMAVWLY